jgi:predicted house-cleaning noncanonical NTP pyrophosphatase (MazG superfamily)
MPGIVASGLVVRRDTLPEVKRVGERVGLQFHQLAADLGTIHDELHAPSLPERATGCQMNDDRVSGGMAREKLVRDKIEQFSIDKQDGRRFRRAEDGEIAELLWRKVIEESQEVCLEVQRAERKFQADRESGEFFIAPASLLEEIADLKEALKSLEKRYGVQGAQVEAVRRRKVLQKGSFDQGWVLDLTSQPDPSAPVQVMKVCTCTDWGKIRPGRAMSLCGTCGGAAPVDQLPNMSIYQSGRDVELTGPPPGEPAPSSSCPQCMADMPCIWSSGPSGEGWRLRSVCLQCGWRSESGQLGPGIRSRAEAAEAARVFTDLSDQKPLPPDGSYMTEHRFNVSGGTVVEVPSRWTCQHVGRQISGSEVREPCGFDNPDRLGSGLTLAVCLRCRSPRS